jgi:hypothetical protein
MTSVRIEEDHAAGERERDALLACLREYNHRFMPRSEPAPLCLFLRDRHGAFTAQVDHPVRRRGFAPRRPGHHGRLRAVRKDIARIYTILRERELGITPVQGGAA